MIDIENGNNIMILPLDKLSNNKETVSSSSNPEINEREISRITEQVVGKLRNNKSNYSREGR
jgi:hypothetical protein